MKQLRDCMFVPVRGVSYRLLVPLIAVTLLGLSFRAAGKDEPAKKADQSVSEGTTNVDSLRSAIEQLRHEADQLRRKAESLDDDGASKGPVIPPEPVRAKADTSGTSKVASVPKDTVELLSKEGTQAFLESFGGRRRGARERGYGGGVSAVPGMYVLSMRPVHQLLDVIASSSDFEDITFPLHSNFQGFFMMGIAGYGALGNGLRVGGSYQGGSRSYSTRQNDTTYTVDIHSSFGGFLFEKAAVTGNMNWFVGGMAGGAVIDVNPSKASNLFSNIDPDSELGKEYNQLSASALLLELHGGFTYTMVKWFHIGGELSTPLFFSPSGFRTRARQSITNGFISVNPGFRIRIVLGNIG